MTTLCNTGNDMINKMIGDPLGGAYTYGLSEAEMLRSLENHTSDSKADNAGLLSKATDSFSTEEESRKQAELRMEIDVIDLEFPRWMLFLSQLLL